MVYQDRCVILSSEIDPGPVIQSYGLIDTVQDLQWDIDKRHDGRDQLTEIHGGLSPLFSFRNISRFSD